MLQTIREAIKDLDNKPKFKDFYQNYVKQSQDSIIKHNVEFAAKQYTDFEDSTLILEGLNSITEELKYL